MSKKSPDLFFSITAFVLYVVGGFGIFGGVALIAMMGGKDLFGWGDGKTIGYLIFCVGVCLSVMGVLFLRIIRNRTNLLLIKSSSPMDKQ